ncbi:hypothetical protein Acsp07_37560 [Actinomycetospora sp. NBRC 106378]|nr:hypothetical protein Acsp07_37560 [Actinomycetospora sp. NBRC 106378]
MLQQAPAGREEVVRHKVHVLVVDDHRGVQVWPVTLLGHEKAPPIPEDGGELGLLVCHAPSCRSTSGPGRSVRLNPAEKVADKVNAVQLSSRCTHKPCVLSLHA